MAPECGVYAVVDDAVVWSFAKGAQGALYVISIDWMLLLYLCPLLNALQAWVVV
jgi:hypothetical protein